MQGPSLGAWSEEKPQAHPKELNSSSAGQLVALHSPFRPQGDTLWTRGSLGEPGRKEERSRCVPPSVTGAGPAGVAVGDY